MVIYRTLSTIFELFYRSKCLETIPKHFDYFYFQILNDFLSAIYKRNNLSIQGCSICVLDSKLLFRNEIADIKHGGCTADHIRQNAIPID